MSARPGSGLDAFIQALDAFGDDEQVCPPGNTGNTRNQSSTINFVDPGSGNDRTRFNWIDTITDLPAVLTFPDVIVHQDVMGIFYNVEHWENYPPAQRWDANTTPVDLGRTTPVDSVLHLAGVENAGACAGYGSFILDYPVSATRPWTSDPVLMSVIGQRDPDQFFPDPLFGGNRVQVQGVITAVDYQEPIPLVQPELGPWVTVDFAGSEQAGVAGLADNFLSNTNFNWVVHPPLGNSEGGTAFNIQDRRYGPLGTDQLGTDPDFGGNLGWLNSTIWRGFMSNVPVKPPLVGATVRMTQI